MKMKSFNKLAIAAIVSCPLIGTNMAVAGDDPVNCRTEVVDTQKIYAGTASCMAQLIYTYHSKLEAASQLCLDAEVVEESVNITQYIPERTSPVVLLSENVEYKTQDVTCNTINERKTVECLADVPFSHIEEIDGEVCDYTPKVKPYDNGFGVVYAAASDRDGSIVSYEWWIDGVKQSVTGGGITLKRESYMDTRVRSVRVKVTDNDGYTDSKTIGATPYIPNSCDGRRC